MFKKSIIALLCCAAYLCCAMELAEKHLVDLQARCAFGEEDPVMALNAEADLLAVKLALMPPHSRTAEQDDRLKSLREKAFRLAEVRYRQGLCSYLQVHRAKVKRLCSGQFSQEAWLQLLKETAELAETRQNAGVADTHELDDIQRLLPEYKLFAPDTDTADRTELIRQIRQNFEVAERQAQNRYKHGFSGHDDMAFIQYQRAAFELKLSSEGGITSEEQIEANRRNAAIVCQTYEKMAAEQQVSPSILLQARLDYLLAQRCVEKMEK